jgi:hypothetical protein
MVMVPALIATALLCGLSARVGSMGWRSAVDGRLQAKGKEKARQDVGLEERPAATVESGIPLVLGDGKGRRREGE